MKTNPKGQVLHGRCFWEALNDIHKCDFYGLFDGWTFFFFLTFSKVSEQQEKDVFSKMNFIKIYPNGS